MAFSRTGATRSNCRTRRARPATMRESAADEGLAFGEENGRLRVHFRTCPHLDGVGLGVVMGAGSTMKASSEIRFSQKYATSIIPREPPET